MHCTLFEHVFSKICNKFYSHHSVLCFDFTECCNVFWIVRWYYNITVPYFVHCAAYPAVYGQFEQSVSQHIPATLLPAAASFNSLTNLTRKDGVCNVPTDLSQ